MGSAGACARRRTAGARTAEVTDDRPRTKPPPEPAVRPANAAKKTRLDTFEAEAGASRPRLQGSGRLGPHLRRRRTLSTSFANPSGGSPPRPCLDSSAPRSWEGCSASEFWSPSPRSRGALRRTQSSRTANSPMPRGLLCSRHGPRALGHPPESEHFRPGRAGNCRSRSGGLSCIPGCREWRSGVLDEHRNSLAPASAHRGDAEFGASSEEFMGQGEK